MRVIVVGFDSVWCMLCGFVFVEYEMCVDVEWCVWYLNGMKLDDCEIRIDFDWGYESGCEFGRGKFGG